MSRRRVEPRTTFKVKTIKVDLENGSAQAVEDEVSAEEKVKLYVNNELHTVFTCTPLGIKELIIGHLLTEGIVNSPKQINGLHIKGKKVFVDLDRKDRAKPPTKGKVSSNLELSPETVLGAMKMLSSLSAIFKRTGGTHAAALLTTDGEVLAFSEDIGRHNAVDKALGEAAMKSVNLERSLLASTGRLVSEIVRKAARVGVPVVASVSAPTDKGIEVAEKAGMTLIGFARGARFNIYARPERIKQS